MKKFSFLFALVLCAIVFLTSGCSMFRKTGRTRANTLLVAGNYLDSRLLAELAQYRTKQPIVLFSVDLDGSYQMFFIPDAKKDVEPSPVEKFSEIITYVNPKRVVFLGGNDVIPSQYVQEAKKVASTLVLDGDNWSMNAKELGHLMNQGRLQREFDDFKARLDNSELIKE